MTLSDFANMVAHCDTGKPEERTTIEICISYLVGDGIDVIDEYPEIIIDTAFVMEHVLAPRYAKAEVDRIMAVDTNRIRVAVVPYKEVKSNGKTY